MEKMDQLPCVYCGRLDKGLGQVIEQEIEGVQHVVMTCASPECNAKFARDMDAVFMRSSLDAEAYRDVNNDIRYFGNGHLLIY
jgi:hypothetical protein